MTDIAAAMDPITLVEASPGRRHSTLWMDQRALPVSLHRPWRRQNRLVAKGWAAEREADSGVGLELGEAIGSHIAGINGI